MCDQLTKQSPHPHSTLAKEKEIVGHHNDLLHDFQKSWILQIGWQNQVSMFSSLVDQSIRIV